MGFNNPTTQRKAQTDVKKELKKMQLQQSIDAMGDVLKNLEKEAKKKSQQEEQLLGVSEDIGSKQAELDNLSARHTELLNEIALKSKELSKFEGLTEKLSAVKQELVDFDNKKNELSKIKSEILTKQTNLDTLNADYTSKQQEIKENISNLDKTIKEKKDKLSKLTDDFVDLSVEKTTLEEELKTLNSNITKSRTTLNDLTSKIEELKNDYKDKKTKAVEDLKNELALIQDKFDKDNKKKTLELETREGEVSIRESWLKDKETYLLNTKSELEKFWGEKIGKPKKLSINI